MLQIGRVIIFDLFAVFISIFKIFVNLFAPIRSDPVA